ncbi:T9SS type A sorting domain-containing protein [Bizionia gelidisalsuginis]|uniref:T9SS type A sorting domain-containing protein n=1 Tax=Bizionia gelidisalsuginis TaxID=291188 RepID=A0ABY3MAM7_9FLAO|nr:T9SS type A sorting domain-containing protein [Bizionia gelidisalsuginis]TYC12808.1 T9SS type A sorting domain-containing protein [Bizionia gelidisalsuginis]
MKIKLLLAILSVIVMPLFAQNNDILKVQQKSELAKNNESKKRAISDVQPSALTVIIISALAPTGDANQSFCSSALPTLSDVIVDGNNIQWYDANSLGNTLPLGTSLLDNTSYFATQTVGGDESDTRLEVLVTLLADDDASFSYSGSTFCNTAYDPSPTINGLAGGTFTSSPVGLIIEANTGSVDVSASAPNTYAITYTTTGDCVNSATVSLAVNSADDASFSYSASAFCETDSDPVPTVTGLAGGTFTSSPSGLVIDATTGSVDLSSSTTNTYSITYITNGNCINSSTVSLTVNSLDDASFSYSASTFCTSDSDAVPTVTGLAGGTFTSSPSGLVIDATTGSVDVSASGTNSYTITYNTNGNCANNSTVAFTVNSLDDASFSYSASTFCTSDSDAVPTVTGLAGGTFTSSPSGLVIDATTGSVDVSASGTNSYSITYTTNGNCANSSTVVFTVNTISTLPTGASPQSFSSATNPTFADVIINGDNLQWYDTLTGGNFISISTSLTDGTFYVSKMPDGECESERLEIEILLNTLAINTFDKSIFSVYPNPNNGQFDISFTKILKNPKVQLFDIRGRMVFEQTYNISEQKLKVSTSILEGGVYIVRITAHSTVIDKKIIITK